MAEDTDQTQQTEDDTTAAAEVRCLLRIACVRDERYENLRPRPTGQQDARALYGHLCPARVPKVRARSTLHTVSISLHFQYPKAREKKNDKRVLHQQV